MLHLADIHINTTRHAPKAYQQLFRHINATARDITVICGDVFDGLATPGDILVFTQLITAINTPLVLIAGNHDYDMRSPATTNMIEAVLAAYPRSETSAGATYTLPNTTIYFAARPGAFRCGEFPAVFTLILPNADESAAPAVSAVSTEATRDAALPRIALVHAPTIPAPVIAAHDFVLAGDIHVRRFITPTAAYCGSPMQVNIKEPSDRGGILWDLATRRGTAVNFPSKYGYAKYTETALQPGYTLPKHPYLIRVDSADADITAKLAVLGIPVGRCQIIRPYPVVPDATVAEAVYARQQDLLQMDKPTRLHVHYLEFANIRCYGPDNHINFADLGGLHCLVADNRHGKTSIIYALCIALYGRPPRGELKHALRGPAGFARCTFTCGATYTVTHTYRSGRLHGYSLQCDGHAVAIATGGDLYERICNLIGPMSRFLMLFAPLNIRDDFTSRPAAEQLSAIHAICGHHKYTEWIKTVRKEAAQHLAATKALAPAPQTTSTDLQQCVRAKRAYKTSANTDTPELAEMHCALAALVPIVKAADAAYTQHKRQYAQLYAKSGGHSTGPPTSNYYKQDAAYVENKRRIIELRAHVLVPPANLPKRSREYLAQKEAVKCMVAPPDQLDQLRAELAALPKRSLPTIRQLAADYIAHGAQLLQYTLYKENKHLYAKCRLPVLQLSDTVHARLTTAIAAAVSVREQHAACLAAATAQLRQLKSAHAALVANATNTRLAAQAQLAVCLNVRSALKQTGRTQHAAYVAAQQQQAAAQQQQAAATIHLQTLKDARNGHRAKKTRLVEMIEPLVATEQDVRKAEYAELKQQVVRAREHINRINIHAHTEHLAAIQTAEYNYTVCSAHLTMLGTMAATAFSVFVAAVQEIATELLAGTVISMVVRGTDTLTVELLTNGTCVDLDAASGFEYTMGSLVLRAAMLKIYGGSLMVIDDATDQISATMCSTLLLLLNRVAAILPTVIVITQVVAIQAQLPQLKILRDGFSRLAIGDVVAIADVPADCRNNPVVIGAQPHYIQVAGGYLCTRCTKRTIVKNPHTRHNKLHE